MEPLDRPESADDLYLDRGDPTEPWRPIMQGDVFTGVVIPHARDHEAIQITTHPCTMRGAQGRLKPVLQAAPVVNYQQVPLENWRTGHLRVLPLPDLQGADSAPRAALFDQVGLFLTDELDLDRRLACLSDEGILLLQQRFVCCLTRVNLKLSTLDVASRHVLEEAELLEEWNETLARPRVGDGEDLASVLEDEAAEFDALLSAGDPQLRLGLLDPATRAQVRRAVRQEIVARTP